MAIVVISFPKFGIIPFCSSKVQFYKHRDFPFWLAGLYQMAGFVNVPRES